MPSTLCWCDPASLPAGEASAWIAAWILPIDYRPSDILPPAVPHRTVAQQALEVVSVADGGFRRGGCDYLCVLFRGLPGCPRTDPEPARNRRFHGCLEGCSGHHSSSAVWRNSPSGVDETARGRRGRAPTAQMVRLRRRDIRRSHGFERRHFCSEEGPRSFALTGVAIFTVAVRRFLSRSG